MWTSSASTRGTGSTSGPNSRKWERRFLLTTELLVKEGYARLIKLGTQSLYDAPKPVTAVVLTHAPVVDAAHPDYQPLQPPTADGLALATIPRYEGFTIYGRWLAAQGIDFLRVAGNDGEILVSELVPDGDTVPDVRVVFEQPILTRPGLRRSVLAVPVARLGAELRRAEAARETIEHIYDF
jgi:hypothetical protein